MVTWSSFLPPYRMNTIQLPECPKCGRRDKVQSKSDELYGMAIFCTLLGFILFLPWLAVPFILVAAGRAKKKGGWICRNCWHRW